MSAIRRRGLVVVLVGCAGDTALAGDEALPKNKPGGDTPCGPLAALELLAAVRPTGGITVNWIESIRVRPTHPDQSGRAFQFRIRKTSIFRGGT